MGKKSFEFNYEGVAIEIKLRKSEQEEDSPFRHYLIKITLRYLMK